MSKEMPHFLNTADTTVILDVDERGVEGCLECWIAFANTNANWHLIEWWDAEFELPRVYLIVVNGSLIR